MTNKNKLWQQLFLELNRLIEVAKAAAKRAHDTATDEESVAENKYDTLGLEAAYLAQGQRERVHQCQLDLEAYQLLNQHFKFTERVSVGSLVTLFDHKDEEHYFFLGSNAGGIKLQFDGIEVLVITPGAPLGKILLGSVIGDDINLNIGSNSIEYEVTAIA